MKIGFGAGTVVFVVLASCGPNDVDLGGAHREDRDDRDEIPAEAGGTSGTGAGGTDDYGTAGAPIGGGGTGPLTCWEDRIETTSCYPHHVFVTFAEETCRSNGGIFSGLSLEGCADASDAAMAATFSCCREGGGGGAGPTTGGTGGSEPTAGSSYGGVSYGGTTSAGGTSAGGIGAGGSIPGTTGGTGGGASEECWFTGIGSSTCADNDVFLGRGYERCELSGGTLSSIAYTAACDAYTSLTAEVTCCRSQGDAGGAAGTGAGGTEPGTGGAN